MEEIRPFSIKFNVEQKGNILRLRAEVIFNKIQCIICLKKFDSKRAKPTDKIFICAKCQCELDGSEIEIKEG